MLEIIGVLPDLSQSFQLRSDGKSHCSHFLLRKDRHYSGPFPAADLHPICLVLILNVSFIITLLITLIDGPMEVNFNPVEAALAGIWQEACSKPIYRWQNPSHLSML